MSRNIAIAVIIQLAIMLLVLTPPLVVKATGNTIYLETEKMDPRALFRGDFVILGYKVAQGILSQEQTKALPRSQPVYVTVSTDRPAHFVAVGFNQPELMPGQACLIGRMRGWSGAVDFPQIAQYFVPEGTGRALESARGDNLLAKVAVADNCKAVLLGLEAL